jgi:tetratricopeptide (TPR) repeat protein
MDALKVFISYRRADTQHVAGRLGDRIGERFRLFMDIDDIPLGVDFTTALNEAVDSSDVLVVLIGQHFLDVTQVAAPRAGQPRDWVLAEVSAALDRGLVVIPVLVDNAEMPEEDELPEALWPLRRRQALQLSHASFNTDVDRLVEALIGLENRKRTPAPTPEPVPSRDALFRDPDYSRAVAAAYRRQLSEAVDLFTAVQRRFPTDARVSTALADARAADAEARGEWYEAVTALQALAAARPAETSVEARLTRARREVEIGDLVGQLRALAAAEEWAGVVAMSQHIAELDPERADPDGLTGTARAQLRARDLDDRYSFGLAELDRGNHRQANEVFEAISRERPGYREVDDLLRMTRERIGQAAAHQPSSVVPAIRQSPPPATPPVPEAPSAPTRPLAYTGRIWLVIGGMTAVTVFIQAMAHVRLLELAAVVVIVAIVVVTVQMRMDVRRLEPRVSSGVRTWSTAAVISGLIVVIPVSAIARPIFERAHYYTIGDHSAGYWANFLVILLGQVALCVAMFPMLRRTLGRAAIWPALLYLACALLMTLFIVGSYGSYDA